MAWIYNVCEKFACSVIVVSAAVTMTSSAKIRDYLTREIGNCETIALLLDYDGTLAPISKIPSDAVMRPETRQLLDTLSKSGNIHIAVISGRMADEARSMVRVGNVTYAGSLGFEIIYADGERYTKSVSVEDKEKIDKVKLALENEVIRDGSWVETKGNILTFHYQETPADKRPILIEHARSVIKRCGLTPHDAIESLDIQPSLNWHKGYAGQYILETKFGKDWENRVKVIFAGDDLPDERLIEMLKGKAATFRIANSDDIETMAGFRLKSLDEVVIVLEWLKEKFCQN